MRRTSPRRFAPLARLCVATVVSLVLASVPKLGDTRESFDQIVGVGERGEELGGVRPWQLPATHVLQLEGVGFAAARKRWGLHKGRNPPYIDKWQREVLENLGLVWWVVQDSRPTSRTVRTRGLMSRAEPLHNRCALECFALVKSSALLTDEQMLADYEQHRADAMWTQAPNCGKIARNP
eukprot:COSAG02_NODE_3009_length_7559_cov_14.154424_4_plen_180_part_00